MTELSTADKDTLVKRLESLKGELSDVRGNKRVAAEHASPAAATGPATRSPTGIATCA